MRRLEDLVEDFFAEDFGERVEEVVASEEPIAEPAREVVRRHVDLESLRADTEAVAIMQQIWQELQKRRRIEDDDAEIFMLM